MALRKNLLHNQNNKKLFDIYPKGDYEEMKETLHHLDIPEAPAMSPKRNSGKEKKGRKIVVIRD